MKQIPNGFAKRDPVKISSPEFRGFLIGLVSHACKWDEGVVVWVPEGVNEAKYWCIDPHRKGETIEKVTKEEPSGNFIG